MGCTEQVMRCLELIIVKLELTSNLLVGASCIYLPGISLVFKSRSHFLTMVNKLMFSVSADMQSFTKLCGN